MGSPGLAVFLLLGRIFLPISGPHYDIVISGGIVLDGSGAPAKRADVAITGDTITAIGDLGRASAGRRIDAGGLVVAPGFIDIHSHARGGIFRVPGAPNYLRQGVTTVLEGHDGFSAIPLGSFLARVEDARPAIHFASLVGQGSIREAVMGSENRAATPLEVERMKALVREAMAAGAFGLSTGLLYVPGSYTPPEEIIALARVAGESGGIYITHMRDEAARVVDCVKETIRVSEEARLPAQVTHHKVVGSANWGLSRETLRLIDEARRRGLDITIDQYPYTASSTGTQILFPQWAFEGGRTAFLRRLADPADRERIKATAVERLAKDRGAGDPANVAFALCGFDRSLDGLTLADAARRSGKPVTLETAAEAAIEIERQGGCVAVFHAGSEQDVERILLHPATMIGSDGEVPVFGEGVPHPRSYGTFARVLGHYVRERKLLSLEEAVRKMTSAPAARLGLKDRGILKAGMKADIAVFDPARIADRATYREPHQYAVGVRHVFVNGAAVLLDGEITGARPGRVLYGPGARSRDR